MGPVDFRIGNTIRMLRIVRGLSQQALAWRLNVTFQQVQKYEKAKTQIATSRLYDVARILDTPVEVFFDSQGMDRGGQSAIRELVDRYDRLSPQFGYHEFVELNRAFVGISSPAVREAILNLIMEIAPAGPDTPETALESGEQEPAKPAPAERSECPGSLTADPVHLKRTTEAEPA